MNLVLIILSLQWSVVAASVLVGESFGSGNRRLIRVGGLASLMLGGLALYLLHPEAREFFPRLSSSVHFLVIYLLVFGINLAILTLPARGGPGWARAVARYLALGIIMAIQGLMVGMGVSLLGLLFKVEYITHGPPYYYLTVERLALMTGATVLGGALLLSAATRGALAAWRVMRAPEATVGHVGLAWACFWIALALGVRLFAVAASLGLAGWGHPVSASFFVEGLLEGVSTIVGLRLVLLVLPVGFLALVAADLMARNPHRAALHFYPMLVVTVIAEAVAACLTVGAWGVGF